MRHLFSIWIILTVLATVRAQDVPLAVYVEHSDTDHVGISVAYWTREFIRQSQNYHLVSPNDPELKWIISIVSREVTAKLSKSDKTYSVLSVCFYIRYPQNLPVYLSHTVMFLNSDEVDKGAEQIIAELDKTVEKLLDTIPPE
ncbi:MAG: hypothetical protein Kow0042_02450 [Calditrichia bacterium]